MEWYLEAGLSFIFKISKFDSLDLYQSKVTLHFSLNIRFPRNYDIIMKVL